MTTMAQSRSFLIPAGGQTGYQPAGVAAGPLAAMPPRPTPTGDLDRKRGAASRRANDLKSSAPCFDAIGQPRQSCPLTEIGTPDSVVANRQLQDRVLLGYVDLHHRRTGVLGRVGERLRNYGQDDHGPVPSHPRRTRRRHAGAEALRQARELRPDVALVDTSLGAESGFDVGRQITPHVGSVILISSRDQDDYAELIADSAAADFLIKAELSADAIARLLT